ncbi:GNAT family N-acetyltransferase [Lactobacillus sp. CBA3606]|uniref:GNAT family N-acetyltransferase n=1 Tax=Lactobacillus sp. CBA3606 TaxID=2099789 RepID=UPI000CFCDAB0|nr:GNAT family N-acetyltransferase [Lactobacillus sp. CBA3606]AVK62870.1 GNAT family N-acetyltransferase [Lactobacillus sp. CBA3606]
MAIEIRSVTVNDIESLQQVSIETFSDTFGTENSKEDLEKYLKSAYNKPKLLAEIKNPDTDFQLIYYNDDVAGYLKLNENTAQTELKVKDAIEVERIYIRKSFHRLGLGSRLINYAYQQATRKHKHYIWLGVWEHNLGAMAFYKKQGFSAFSAHIFNLGNDQQRDILMKKELLTAKD